MNDDSFVFYDLDGGEYVPMIEVDLDDPASVARTLRENTSPQFIADMRRLLDE